MSTSITRQTSPTRRLSIIPNARSRQNSISASFTGMTAGHAMDASIEKETEITIHIEGDDKAMIRPNKIMRGTVKVRTKKTLYSSQLRIKFRGVECACAKVKEAGLDSKLERIEKITTTYFEIETIVWGTERSAYAINSWKSVEPGEHEYKFALKFPNVNFPPSIDDPTGFSIRYIWTAYMDGPANHPGIRSEELVTPYRPLLVAPAATPWTFQDTLYKYKDNKKTPLATVKAKLPAQVFCPDQLFLIDLEINAISSDVVIGSVAFKLRKVYEGKLLLQRGTVHRLYKRDILQTMVPVKGNNGSLRLPDVRVQLPSRLVSPCFTSNHVRVYYYLIFMIQFDSGNLLKSTHHVQFEIPIGIANLSNQHLARVRDLTCIQDYKECRDAPVFFNPDLDAPPTDFAASNSRSRSNSSASSSVSYPMHPDAHYPAPPSLTIDEETLFQPMSHISNMPPMGMLSLSPPIEESLPPAYFSLSEVPQFILKERIEKTRYSSRLVKPNVCPELGEPLVLESYFDDEW
ncbi:methionine-synthesizing 5- methyltetrahydropteroyltriglutamate--homocysteine methyltransferase [Mucor velutinosus]|uniref:Methionine-synthesizing 5-methyltetrahydropteroyltriglutamate--homocysteine methyltransferase n=1 Tax=Mucor velutinosus TaxID=708070 RepID=A0AAN7DFR5_9FUNG|nr:methionine-synthesizing 5- methyltetrahydropteroyltriglutamate--homocysteine methyltransferase [Mucor velutinosus]